MSSVEIPASFVGSVMASYPRVLAERLGTPCGIGICDRAARVTVLILMLLLEKLLIGLAILPETIPERKRVGLSTIRQ